MSTEFARAALQAKSAGMIVNTMGWIEGLGYELFLHSIQTLKVRHSYRPVLLSIAQ